MYYDDPNTLYNGNEPYSGGNGAYQPSQQGWRGDDSFVPPTPEEPKKKRRTHHSGRLVALCICVALLGSLLGGGGAYLLMRGQVQSAVEQALSAAENHNTVTPNNTGSSVASTQTTDLSSMIEQVSPAIVAIQAQGTGQSSFFGNGSTTVSSGSGVIIRSDGIIVTSAHVIEGTNDITVYLKDGSTYKATVVGSDSKSDLAVLKIDASGLTAVSIGDSTQTKVGEPAIVIGNPLGELNGSVTIGYISALERTITVDGHVLTVMQTDASINPGNSGGALLNSKGELIGIVCAKSSAVEVEGLGFAIPMHIASDTIEQLLNYGYVKDRPYIGISFQQMQNRGNNAGIYIVQIANNSPAQAAGLQIGDRIVSVNDQQVSESTDIDQILKSCTIGQTIPLVVERNGQQVTVSVTLVETPQQTN